MKRIKKGLRCFLVVCLVGWPVLAATPASVPSVDAGRVGGLSEEEETVVRRDLELLGGKLARIESRLEGADVAKVDRFADVSLFHKGAVWALRYETNLNAKEVALVRHAVARGMERADELLAGRSGWTAGKGRQLRGYVSAVDGSTQLYGVIVPARYDGKKGTRLDVVLHGSMQSSGLSQLRFGAQFDEGDGVGQAGSAEEFIELHPLGRVENCYRWAGETDVFEAIEAVCRNYNIDRDRIVLRGMSMGASGTWHLGLKHPDRFVAIGPYCGYVDTHRFSETAMSNFVKVGPLPSWQEHALHMLDSVDYAANAGVVPAIAAIGDKDPFFQAHVIMGEAMAREGLQMVNLIAPGTAHVIDPATHREQMRRIGEYASKGLDHAPKALRFVTWTLKYNRCHWLEVRSLKEHYERAELVANADDDGSVEVTRITNISSFAIHPPMLRGSSAKVRINGVEILLPIGLSKASGQAVVLTWEDGRWRSTLGSESTELTGKRPGLQGPIDDAFTGPFLCVRGTGKPWNSAIGDWAEASLRRFSFEWARYMGGDLPIKNDTEVSDEDIRTHNLILFGDPGSNSWISKALPKLPISWDSQELRLGDNRLSSADCAPAIICPNPFAHGTGRYIVLNSGHTFHQKELGSLNYLLFPHLGDWALVHVLPGAQAWKAPSASFPEEVVRTGFFDKQWKNPDSRF